MRAFVYDRVEDLPAAVRAGNVDGTAFLAGGTTLLDLMKLDVMRPQRVIDINDLAKAHGRIEASESGLYLGAFAHMSEAADHPAVRRDYPVIAQSLDLAASVQIRNMATLGGNVLQRTRCNYFRDPSWPACNKRNPGSGCAALEGVNRKHAVLGVSEHCIATYPGDFAQALIALDAVVEIAAPEGMRRFPFAELHRLPEDHPEIETVLKPGEVITGFRIEGRPWMRRSLYLKIRDRQSYEFALASAAVALDLAPGDGRREVREARVALGGVATKPWRSREAEAALRGQAMSESTAAAAAAAAFAHASPRGEASYKVELGRQTLVRALMSAAAMEA
jgi:xanthine dehydrogenase YagS FAD-binding subunit